MTPSAQTAGGRRTRRWTRELIIDKILEWDARYGEPPCSADWNPSLARWRAQEWRAERYREGVWPSTNAAKRPFGGSFDAAVRAAGLEPRRPGPRRAAGAARPAVEQRAPARGVGNAAGADVVALDQARRARERVRVTRSEPLVADGRRRLTTGELAALRSEAPSGPAVLASALRRLAKARAAGDRRDLRVALGEVASAAVRWHDRL